MHRSQNLDAVRLRPHPQIQPGWMVQLSTRKHQIWHLIHPFHRNWMEAQLKWCRPCWTLRIMPNILHVLSCLLEEVQFRVALVICIRGHSRPR